MKKGEGVRCQVSGVRGDKTEICWLNSPIRIPHSALSRLLSVIMVLSLISLTASAQDIKTVSGEVWPTWRGPDQNGLAPGNPPVNWSETENIKWKTEIPGEGHGTPVVYNGVIFLPTAVSTGTEAAPEVVEKKNERIPGWRKRMNKPSKTIHSFKGIALDLNTGAVKWEKELRKELPNESVHKDSTWASGSPVTDGKHVWFFFGSHGLFCLDLNGNVKWEKDFGRMNTRASFGEGISPALYKDMIIINWDHEGESFITALNKETGDEIWKKDRDERTSWSTPLIVDHGGKTQMIVSATGKSRGYDPSTGDVLWECGGMTGNVIPMPVYGHGNVYLMSGFRGAALQCIALDAAKGDITGTDVIRWSIDKNTSYTPSGLLYGNIFYFLKTNSGTLTAVDAKTGEVLYGPQKLDGMKVVYSSLTGASGKIYIADRNGLVYVLQHGTKYMVLGTNRLEDGFTASPVITGDQLLLRGHKNLYCIAEKKKKTE